jgi:hypothetical protein
LPEICAEKLIGRSGFGGDARSARRFATYGREGQVVGEEPESRWLVGRFLWFERAEFISDILDDGNDVCASGVVS